MTALSRHAGAPPVLSCRAAWCRAAPCWIAALLVLLCLLRVAAAETLTFPALAGPVVDEAGLLSPADRAALRDTLTALEAKTGVQVVVVTLSSLRGTTIEDYGVQLGRAWAIGRKGANTGALLLVAPNEHAVRIETGYGLEGALTDAAGRLIIESVILPRFRANDFPGGIRAGVDQIAQVLTGDPGLTPPAPTPSLSTPVGKVSIWPVLVLGLLAVVVLIHCAVRGGAFCQFLFQMLYMMALSGGGSRSQDSGSSYSGRGGSFGGGGASGKW